METLTIKALKRDKVGSRATKALRAQGMVPAVVYGHGMESFSLALPQNELEIGLRHNVRIMSLDLEDSLEQVLIKDLQYDVFGDQLLHVDLIRVSSDEVVSMPVGLTTTGRAKGVDQGGILEMIRNEVMINCLPSNIPDGLTVDVSNLEIGDTLHMRDIVLPEGVNLEDDPDLSIISIVARVEVKEEAPVEGEEGGEEPGEGEGGEADGKDKKDDED